MTILAPTFWIPQEAAAESRITCRYFMWEAIPGTITSGVGQYNRKGEQTIKGWLPG